jgi:hypothetical protein
MDFFSAVSACDVKGQYLASLTSQADMDRALEYKFDSIWLGARYHPEVGSWQWEDGSAWNWTNWADGQPTKRSNCAYLNGDGKWRVTVGCQYTRQFICGQAKDNTYSIYGTKNITLVYYKSHLTSSLLTVFWNYRESQKTKMPGMFLQ